jgi:hypothetical protein
MVSSGDDDDMAEFDNLNQEIQQTEVVNKKKEVKSGGIDSLMRTLSCLPCLPAYEEMPKTPNIDKVHTTNYAKLTIRKQNILIPDF